MNPLLDKLHAYPFEKLAALKAKVQPPESLNPIALSIGEPKHAPPQFVLDEYKSSIDLVSHYAATRGTIELRQAISSWATKRFCLQPESLSAEKHILPVNGTREALFAFAQCCVNNTTGRAKVLMPNPFYQIYEGAALLAGAEPVYINCSHTNQLPNVDAVPSHTWDDCQLLYLCSPGNPGGAVLQLSDYEKIIALADKHDFVIASDECYSELYFDEAAPPLGLLQACAILGRDDFDRCLVFHSLSKRSNLPGLRSGFVAGSAALVNTFFAYRTYHGCAMSLPVQRASIAAWSDETHVLANRDLYREKFARVIAILREHMPVQKPDAGFYLWLQTPYDDKQFAADLYAQHNITVLPGSFLARDTQDGNPGANRVRIALVATLDECIEAAQRIAQFVQKNPAP